MFPRDSNYNYSDVRLFLVKVYDKDLQNKAEHVEYHRGTKSFYTRDTYLELTLQEGLYYLFAEVDWRDDAASFVNNHCCVTCYGASKVDLQDVSDKFERADVARAACTAILQGRSVTKEIKVEVNKYD